MKDSNSNIPKAALLALLTVLILASGATVQAELPLAGSAFYGGSGDQRGTAISIGGDAIYVSGNGPEIQSASATALLLKYSTPLGASPLWSRSWGYGNFSGLALTNEGVYGAGYSHPYAGLTSDGYGGAEVKSILAKFALDGSSGPGPGGSQLYGAPNFFSYRGVESHAAAASAVEGGAPFIYAAGGGQPCSYSAYIVAKYNSSGGLVAAVTDSTVGINFGACWIPSYGGSYTHGVTVLNGKVYVAGSAGWSHEGDSPNVRPALYKYEPNLSLAWRRKDTSLTGYFLGVTSSGSAVYAVGLTFTPGVPNSENFLIQKYDEAGNLQWSNTWGGAGQDYLTGVAIGSRLFAVGWSTSPGGLGGEDAVIFEIDPANGSVLSQTLWGGSQTDRANAVTTDGTNLYVVGESRSFAVGGNAVGQNDLVVLQYALAPPVVDSTPPQITIYTPPANATYYLGESVPADYECADEVGGSGLASCSGTVTDGGPIDTASVGSKAFTVTAADNAGNQSSLTNNYSVVYNYGGFFSPVDNAALNVAKGGSAIPVKFSLSGDQGLNIFWSGYPSSQQINCETVSLIEGTIEETATAGSSTLSYDPVTDQYTYVWKTSKAWANTCRQLTVRTNDGVNHTANFKFK